ncbi:hypothetical protein AMJ47_03930 [Parcubacteria bacterium DG_72]|nr:MAG: hypothetical protein AMJ47_03930 [Parcubacteria bacterium DG_72]
MPEESEEINIEKLKKEYPEFFKKTSSKIVELVLSEKTSVQIAEICVKNEIEDEEKIEEIARRIVFVLLGKLPKENLYIALEKGVGLGTETAKKISDEVNKVIFSQMPLSEKKEIAEREIVEKKPISSKKDIYREPIE